MDATERLEHAARLRRAFDESVDAHIAKHGGTRAAAVDAVAFSPAFSEYHRLEKEGRRLERELAKRRPQDGESANETLQRLADEQQKARGLTRAQAVLAASDMPEFSQVHARERAQKLG
jgi:hypothetical protein